LCVIKNDYGQRKNHRMLPAKGLLNAPFVLPHLMLTHPQVRFEFAVYLLSGKGLAR